uniref:Uncharacterized protein n=1 Tax=Ornithorhynchus anatinus TaxID=9258 RepID=A0A6I8P6D2_ORNAN
MATGPGPGFTSSNSSATPKRLRNKKKNRIPDVYFLFPVFPCLDGAAGTGAPGRGGRLRPLPARGGRRGGRGKGLGAAGGRGGTEGGAAGWRGAGFSRPHGVIHDSSPGRRVPPCPAPRWAPSTGESGPKGAAVGKDPPHVMNLSTLREGSAMASLSPSSSPSRESEDGPPPLPGGVEPGDPRAKPPVKPKPGPRAWAAKPALPAKPSLLVPLGPRPPRGPLAELPSARKMNMLAGPQPYGAGRRPSPFAPRPAAGPPAGGDPAGAPGTRAGGPGREDGAPAAPAARGPAPGGVRKAPAPFRPASERLAAAAAVEDILAKMERESQREGPASPERLRGSRLTFDHDGGSRYGPRGHGAARGPADGERSGPRAPGGGSGPGSRAPERDGGPDRRARER